MDERYFKMGQIQIGDIAGEAAAGIYAAGIKFSEFWYFIPTMIFISVYPNLLESKRIDENLIGCENCHFKDLCFRKEEDIVDLINTKKSTILGGEDNE